jgi:hypothetical protein
MPSNSLGEEAARRFGVEESGCADADAPGTSLSETEAAATKMSPPPKWPSNIFCFTAVSGSTAR